MACPDHGSQSRNPSLRDSLAVEGHLPPWDGFLGSVAFAWKQNNRTQLSLHRSASKALCSRQSFYPWHRTLCSKALTRARAPIPRSVTQPCGSVLTITTKSRLLSSRLCLVTNLFRLLSHESIPPLPWLHLLDTTHDSQIPIVGMQVFGRKTEVISHTCFRVGHCFFPFVF